MTRVRQRRRRDRVASGPPSAILAYWERARTNLRRRIALALIDSPAARDEAMALRREAITDDDAMAAEAPR